MTAPTTALMGWLQRTVPATPRERSAALWSFAYFFTLLAGYYVLRPLRDQMGIAGGVKNLPWLFTATFLSLLVAQPLYGALVARLPRVKFIPVVYHFFVANLVLFWVLLTFDVEKVIVARAFFVWVSVFNLFAVAVFWSFMADLFTSEARQAAVRVHWRRGHRWSPPWSRRHDLAVSAARSGQPADRGRRFPRTSCVLRASN
jgi:AAA family ATP:ADP antiporter